MAGHGGFLKFKTRPGRCDMVIINSPLKGLMVSKLWQWPQLFCLHSGLPYQVELHKHWKSGSNTVQIWQELPIQL